MIALCPFCHPAGFYIDDETFDSLERNRERISIISKERIADELNKIILSPIPSKGFIELDRCGLLELIFPELVRLQGVETRNGRAHKDNSTIRSKYSTTSARRPTTFGYAGQLFCMI